MAVTFKELSGSWTDSNDDALAVRHKAGPEERGAARRRLAEAAVRHSAPADVLAEVLDALGLLDE